MGATGRARRTRRTAAAAAAAAVLLAGCSSGGADTAAESADGQAARQEAPAGADAAGPPADATGAAQQADGSAGGNPLTVAAVAGRQLIRRAHLTLESSDPQATVDAVRAEADRVGGFVSATDLGRDPDGLLTGTMTLRVPADELDATMQRLTGLETVTTVPDERIETEDVTGQIADVEARLRNLRAVETELRGLLSEVRETTGSADEVLRIFSRIQEVRAEAERLEGRRATLSDRVSLATLDLRVTPAAGAGPVDTKPAAWTPGAVVREALAATSAALQALATGLIWLGVTGVPVLAVTGGPLVLVAWLVRRRRPAAAAADGRTGSPGS